MPRLIISEHTARLIREQTLPGSTFRETARPLGRGLLELKVDDEVHAAIEEARLSGESDDDVVGRLLRAADPTDCTCPAQELTSVCRHKVLN